MGLGPITVGIIADMSKFASEAKKGFTDALPQIDLSAKHLGRMAGEAITTGVKVGMVAIGAAVAAGLAGATYAMTSFVSQGLALSDSLSDASQKLGIGSSTLLLFGEAARQTGTDVEAVQTAMGKLNVKVGEALLGNPAATQSFADLGISLQQLQGLAPDQQFQLVADAIGRVPDAAMRAAYAVDVFGKSGQNIVASLGEIGAKSQELAQYWIDLGAVITNEQINAAGGIQDRIDLMHAGLDRFKILLAAEMVPLLSVALDWMENLVISAGGMAPAAEIAGQWMETLAGYIVDAAQLFEGVGYLLVGLGEIAGNFSDSWQFASDNLSSFMEIAIGESIKIFGKFVNFAWEQLNMLAAKMPSLFDDVAMSIVGSIFPVFKWMSSAFKALWAAAKSGWDAVFPKFDKGIPIKIDTSKNAVGEAMVSYGDAISKSGSKKLGDALANNPLMKGIGDTFNKGLSSIGAVLGGGDGRWSDQFRASLADQKANAQKDTPSVAASQIAKSNQQLINERAAWQSQYMQTGNAAPSFGVQLPSSAAYNTTPVSSYGPPVTVNQTFAPGFDAHAQRQLGQSIKRETIAAVQQKVAQGGNYRREIQC